MIYDEQYKATSTGDRSAPRGGNAARCTPQYNALDITAVNVHFIYTV